MYQNRYIKNYQPNGDRFIGTGFLGPFILGGITGGLLAPNFYPRPMYYYPGPYQYYQPYPMYSNNYYYN